jgi:hypothetical protein
MNGLLDKYAFGWIEEPWSYKTPEFEAFPADDFALAIAEVSTGNFASRDWIYPPIVQRADQHVAGPTIRFLLRSTHYLRIDPKLDRPELSDFLVMVLGFFLGLRLNPAGIGHLHRTPRRKGFLVNFVDVDRDLERAMSRVTAFFLAHETNREAISLANAGFHWYLTSQSYHHAFEMFTFQYSVLDNVHKLTELLSPSYRAMQSKGHAQRPVNLSAFHNIPLPLEFQDTGSASPNAKRLADARNALVHEARWLGQPLGYAADSESWDMLKNLEHFNSQLLLGAMGIECRFRSALYTRQIQALDVTN